MATTTKKRVRRRKKKAVAEGVTEKATAPKKKKATKKATAKKPLHQRRVTRRSKQFPEGTYNPQLMVPTMRFYCLRCHESQHVVWSDERRRMVQQYGGIPCKRCGDEEFE